MTANIDGRQRQTEAILVNATSHKDPKSIACNRRACNDMPSASISQDKSSEVIGKAIHSARKAARSKWIRKSRPPEEKQTVSRGSIVNRYKRNNRYMAEERHNRLPNKLIEPIPWGLKAILTSSPGGLEHPTHF